MIDQTRKMIGKLVIKIGEHSVGKCMIPGMYDPKIPQKLKEEMQYKEANFKK